MKSAARFWMYSPLDWRANTCVPQRITRRIPSCAKSLLLRSRRKSFVELFRFEFPQFVTGRGHLPIHRNTPSSCESRLTLAVPIEISTADRATNSYQRSSQPLMHSTNGLGDIFSIVLHPNPIPDSLGVALLPSIAHAFLIIWTVDAHTSCRVDKRKRLRFRPPFSLLTFSNSSLASRCEFDGI